MPALRWRYQKHRRSVAAGVSILFATTLAAIGVALSEEHHSNSSSRQAGPSATQTYRPMPPVQTPASTALPSYRQYNSSPPNGTMRIEQYNPPGLNAAGLSATSGTHPIQTNPPGLNTQHPEMALPGGLGAVGGAAASSAPGSGGPLPGAAGPGGYGSTYPVGYQGPSATQPYSYQPTSAASRQFTCRTAHYYCIVPYHGACQCENARRERESGATVD